MKHTINVLLTALCSFLLLTGCGSSADDNGLTEITLQTDWYAQAEHGGFYQAVAQDLYAAAGLDVTLLQGGPNALVSQKVASGAAEFGIGRADDVAVHASRDVPLVILAALMQRDPQALLVHEESGIDEFQDLDGRSVMTTPGAVFIEYLKREYGIDIEVIPLDYGMSRFLADKEFIQQCFITNEPYYVAKEGANPRTLLIANSGFNPYRVIYANRSFVEKNPEVAKAFVEASIKGWNSYMEGPRDAANALIRERNPKMTEEFLDYSIGAMAENNLISGSGPDEATGLIRPERMQALLDTLLEIGLIDEPIDVQTLAPTEYLPADLRAMLDS